MSNVSEIGRVQPLIGAIYKPQFGKYALEAGVFDGLVARVREAALPLNFHFGEKVQGVRIPFRFRNALANIDTVGFQPNLFREAYPYVYHFFKGEIDASYMLLMPREVFLHCLEVFNKAGDVDAYYRLLEIADLHAAQLNIFWQGQKSPLSKVLLQGFKQNFRGDYEAECFEFAKKVMHADYLVRRKKRGRQLDKPIGEGDYGRLSRDEPGRVIHKMAFEVITFAKGVIPHLMAHWLSMMEGDLLPEEGHFERVQDDPDFVFMLAQQELRKEVFNPVFLAQTLSEEMIGKEGIDQIRYAMMVNPEGSQALKDVVAKVQRLHDPKQEVDGTEPLLQFAGMLDPKSPDQMRVASKYGDVRCYHSVMAETDPENALLMALPAVAVENQTQPQISQSFCADRMIKRIGGDRAAAERKFQRFMKELMRRDYAARCESGDNTLDLEAFKRVHVESFEAAGIDPKIWVHYAPLHSAFSEIYYTQLKVEIAAGRDTIANPRIMADLMAREIGGDEDLKEWLQDQLEGDLKHANIEKDVAGFIANNHFSVLVEAELAGVANGAVYVNDEINIAFNADYAQIRRNLRAVFANMGERINPTTRASMDAAVDQVIDEIDKLKEENTIKEPIQTKKKKKKLIIFDSIKKGFSETWKFLRKAKRWIQRELAQAARDEAERNKKRPPSARPDYGPPPAYMTEERRARRQEVQGPPRPSREQRRQQRQNAEDMSSVPRPRPIDRAAMRKKTASDDFYIGSNFRPSNSQPSGQYQFSAAQPSEARPGDQLRQDYRPSWAAAPQRSAEWPIYERPVERGRPGARFTQDDVPREGRRANNPRPISTAAPISTQQYHPSVSEGKHEADDMPAAAPVGAGAGAGASQGPQTARQIEADHAIAEQMQREELEAAEGGGGTPPSAVPNYAEQMAAGSYDPGDGEVPHGHTFEGEQRGAGAGAGAAAGQASAAPQTVIESRKFPPCDFRAPSLNPGLCDARDHGDKKDFKIYQESIDERLEEAVPTTPAEVALTVAAGPVAGKAAQVMKPVVEPLVKPLVKKAAPHVAKVKKALGDRVAGLAGKVMPKASSASAKPKSVVNNGKLPAEPKLKGMRNPKVREAVEKGQQKHKEFAEKVKQKPGWKSEEPHFDKSGKKYIPDATTPSGKLIELKPKTASGVKKGKLQMEKYEDVTGKKGKVVYYDD